MKFKKIYVLIMVFVLATFATQAGGVREYIELYEQYCEYCKNEEQGAGNSTRLNNFFSLLLLLEMFILQRNDIDLQQNK